MTARDPTFRCSTASRLRDESVAGTASTVRSFLLIEHAGPWGVDALRDARLPNGLGAEVARRGAAAKVRPLLVRRPVRRARSEEIRVFAAFADHSRSWLETTVLDDPHDLLEIDVEALGLGRTPGLTPCDQTLLCVCTHGRHDACCAEHGRPVVAALAAAHPETTWEVSHIGGDRFAGNLLVLPQGLYYGRVEPVSALAIADGHTTGQLDLDHLRGRSSYAMPVQFAETALRRQLGETRDDAVDLVSRRVDGDVTHSVFTVSGVAWNVGVRTSPGSTPLQLTCRSTRDNPAPRHELVAISRAG